MKLARLDEEGSNLLLMSWPTGTTKSSILGLILLGNCADEQFPTQSTPLTPVRTLHRGRETRLRELAGDMPIGTYIRDRALGGGAAPRSRRTKAPLKDGNALGQVLTLLGQARIANNLNQLAKAANLGALPVTKETEQDIREGCAYVREMRQLLLTALGLSLIEEVQSPRKLSRIFGEAGSGRRP